MLDKNKEKKKLVSNIVDEDSYKDIAELTIDTISNTLMKSLGYFGSTTIFDDGISRYVTKDGYNILKNIRFQDTIATAILNFIKEVSLSLVKSVGDGSTSSVINSQAMFKEINKRLKEKDDLGGYSRKEISDSLNNMKELISKELTSKSTKIDQDNFHKLKNIATVSNNNDEKLGEMVYEIFSKIGNKGFIFPEVSDNEEDHYSLTRGIETPHALLDNKLINNKDDHSVDFSKPYVVVVNDKLTEEDIVWTSNIISKVKPFSGQGLIFFAPAFSKEFKDYIKNNLHANRNNGSLQAVETDFELSIGSHYHDPEKLEDLAIYTGGSIIDKTMEKEDFYKQVESIVELPENDPEWLLFKETVIGRAERITIDNFKTQIINGYGNGTQKLKDRISEINNEITYYTDMNSDQAITAITDLQKRANSLNNAIAKLYVGGSSQAEKTSRLYLVEDSVHASKSALEYGYVSGGNLSVNKVIKNINRDVLSDLDNLTLDLIDISSREVYHKVLENFNRFSSGEIESITQTCIDKDAILNIKNNEYEDDVNTDIINSVETDIKILETTISIIGLISLSNQFLTNSVIIPQ
ncbi:60 kDa chaperonin 5 [Staphylococcus phage vB_SauM-UFV_DC4]|nr:60 kDa chaperonin 5 [Staphylococcus phage vB_SauM-UFV_DC4]BDE75656.1 60 kDa chaperonin [Staphylococcus phage S6]